jgi:hypothetical protein
MVGMNLGKMTLDPAKLHFPPNSFSSDVFNDSTSELGTNHGDANLLRPSSLRSSQAGSFKGFWQGS